ncbi:MAG: hypothetical protein O2954_10555 [bacterium]|nr:hypothetical protein [bacterium]
MSKWITLTLALTLALVSWTGTTVQANGGGFVDENGDGIDDNATFRHHFGRHNRGEIGRLASLLTAEQLSALKEKVDALKTEGATRDEIHTAINAELEALGIELPTPGLGRVSSLLTEEQLATLTEKIDALKAEGATSDEIHAAVHAELDALGIDLPIPGIERLGSLLTEEQLASLTEKINTLRAEGATHDEIRVAIGAELDALGIEQPTKPMRPHGRMRGRHGRR